MPIAPVPVPKFVTVPDAPGVPPVPRAPGVQPERPQPLNSDDSSVTGNLAAPVWGIFTNGQQSIAVSDCTYFFSEAQEYRIADYPIEDGGFESYDKVTVPNEIRMVLNKGGSASDRQTFRNAIVAAAASLDLLTVVTPEATLTNRTIARYSYERTPEGTANLICMELTLREIRIAAPPAFSNTATPNATPEQNGGTVAAQTPTAAQTAAAGDGAA